MSAARRSAVFLDRDGTLHRELESALCDPDELVILPGALEGAAKLAAAGFALVVVTNQSAIARGTASPAQVDEVNRALLERMAAAGAPVAGVYLCPHHPDEGDPPYRRACSCRKPAPGLIRRAARELDLELAQSWVIGDAERDLAAGRALGVHGVLVLSGKGERELARLKRAGTPPKRTARDLREAAAIVLASNERLAPALRRIDQDLRAIAAGTTDPYECGWRIWGEAFHWSGESEEILWPQWLLWGALTDWVEVRPEETPQAHAAMRRAASEWLALSESAESPREYFERWLSELGYDLSSGGAPARQT